MTQSLAKQLDQLLEDTLIGADSGAPIQGLVERAIRDNRELIERFMEGYLIRLANRTRRELQRKERAEQLFLPGFERIPLQITMADRRRRPIESATFRQLREYLRVLH